MTRLELEKRTKAFAVAVMQFVSKVPKNQMSRILCNQLLRSATSIGANYREANRSQSRRDFGHKIAIVEKESAESLYWIELFGEAMIGNESERKLLWTECNELLAIFTRVGKTTKRLLQSAIRNPQSAIPE